MQFRIILAVLLLMYFLEELFEDYIIIKQRKKPLPDVVNDIYDEKRYAKFISYKNEYMSLSVKKGIIALCFDCFFILSPWYQWFDGLGNEYLIAVISMIAVCIITAVITLISDYYATFTIEEKYGFNRKTKKEFYKEYLLEEVPNLFVMIVLYAGIVFFGSHMAKWTNDYHITLDKSFVLALMLLAVIIIFIVAMTLISLIILRKTYEFRDMEHNDLRKQIENILGEYLKKIKRITIYNESKKSTTKNAFFLDVFHIYREISIADNFLNENDERELLAVLSHEVGHLKHKKVIWDYLKYISFGLFFVILIIALENASILSQFNSYVVTSFSLKTTNYYLTLEIMILFIRPLFALYSMFLNYVSRVNEFDADRYAVKQGYGEDLIKMFKRLCKDELVDVNPSPFIEIRHHDHPSMINRIPAIYKEMKKIKKSVDK